MGQFVVSPGIVKQEQAIASFVPTQPINKLTTFTSFVAPKYRIDKIRKAKEYRNVDIIDRILRVKVDFGVSIKDVRCQNKRQREYYRTYVLPLLKPFAKKWLYEHCSLGDSFIHYCFDRNNLMFITTEDPENIDIESAFGIEQYKVRIDSNTKKMLEQLKKNKQIGKLPEHLREYVNNKQQGDLILTKNNMYRTSNLKPDYELYSEPPLMNIAEAIELRKLLTDTDFVTAYGIKNEIIHFKIGSKEHYAGKERVEALTNLVKNQPPGTMMLFTQHDVEISRSKNDPVIWSADKYKEANSRILQWGGISVTLLTGDGTGYSTAVVSLKALIQSIKTETEVFEEFISHLFKLINEKNNFKHEVKLVLERNALQDHKEFMEEVRLLTQQGVYSIEDLCEIFNLDFEEQKTKKQNDVEYKDIFIPWFEPNQGLLQNEGGRPKTTNSIRDTNQPRPSQ